MASATASLPSDPADLRALAISLQETRATKDRELAARDAEIYAKMLHIEKLRATLALMKRARFGRSSERIEQLELLISDLEEEAAEQQARRDTAADRRPAKAGERRARGRQPLPAHLPRERVVHEAACACPTCGGTALTRLGADEREVLEYVAALFKIEAEINGHEPGRRHAVRQERSLPLLAELKDFLAAGFASISRKSSLAGAIRYSLSRWSALCRFAHDGRLEMTNNAAERAIRPLVLGRKNYLFAGSDAGGRRAAILYTLIQTAVLNGLDPEAYLRDVLARIGEQPINRIDELLPWHWVATQPTASAAA